DGRAWVAYSAPFVLLDGQHVLDFFATDVAGNVESLQSVAIRINTVAPLTTASISGISGNAGWYVSNVTVTLTASDGTGGVKQILYRLDGGGWPHYTAAFTIGEGKHALRFYSTDLAGRSSPVGSLSLNVDPTAPTTTETLASTMGSNGWYVSDVVITLSGFDGVSGIATVE